MQVQAAMFWWPLPMSAYLIRPLPAAEQWKSPALSQKHHSHLGYILLSVINATSQISTTSPSCKFVYIIHAGWSMIQFSMRKHWSEIAVGFAPMQASSQAV